MHLTQKSAPVAEEATASKAAIVPNCRQQAVFSEPGPPALGGLGQLPIAARSMRGPQEQPAEQQHGAEPGQYGEVRRRQCGRMLGMGRRRAGPCERPKGDGDS